MLRLRDTSEFHPRTKNGHAAQSTTGIEKRNCTQPDTEALMKRCRFNPTCPDISRAKTGTVSTRPIQNRRVMSRTSGLGRSSALANTGSSAMPDFGVHRARVDRAGRCLGPGLLLLSDVAQRVSGKLLHAARAAEIVDSPLV